MRWVAVAMEIVGGVILLAAYMIGYSRTIRRIESAETQGRWNAQWHERLMDEAEDDRD